MPAFSDTIETHKYSSCQKNCQSNAHAQSILQAIRSAIEDVNKDQELLAAYIAKTCRNFTRVHENRTTALHVVAQVGVGLARLAEFLINHGADVNAADASVGAGRTPLHYACMFNNVAVAVVLLRRGARLDRDQDLRHPLSYMRAPLSLPDVRKTDSNIEKEMLVWGNMRNYNFGLVRDNDEGHPLQPDIFSRMGSHITRVAISPYHCLFLTESNGVFVVGNGKDGVLGIDTPNTILEPSHVDVALTTPKDAFVNVAASRNTSMLLTLKFQVFTCGINTWHQLGYDVAKQTTFRRVRFPATPTNEAFHPIGIHAQDKYSLAYDHNHVFVWGTCVGQFGSKVKSIAADAIVPFRFSSAIRHLSTSEWAVAISFVDSVVVLHNYQNRIFTLPNQESAIDISLECGTKDDAVRLAVLTSEGILLWVSNVGLINIKSPAGLQPNDSCTQVLFAGRHLHFIIHGDVYRSAVDVEKLPSDQWDQPGEQDFVYPASYQPYVRGYSCKLQYERLPLLSNVHRVYCDTEGKSFVALQYHSNRFIVGPKPQLESLRSQLRELLSEASPGDGLVDVAFVVQGRKFFAHKYVVLSRAPAMQAVLERGTSKDGLWVVNLEEEWLSAKMFDMILKYVYENHTLTDEDVVAINKSLGPDLKDSLVYNWFCKFAKQCGLLKFATGINKTHERTSCRFDYMEHRDLYDVVLYCGERKTPIHAHKCILVARSEYFHMMFSRNWVESDSVELSHVSIECMQLILHYLYTNDEHEIQTGQYSDSFLYEAVMICDQMLLRNLALIFENHLIQRISARKCVEMLRFAIDVNQEHIQLQCIRYIGTNASRLLERRIMDQADEDVLHQIATFMNANIPTSDEHIQEQVLRKICSYQPFSHDALKQFVGKFKVDMNAIPTNRKTPLKVPQKNRIEPKVPVVKSIEDEPVSVPKTNASATEVQQEAARIADKLRQEFDRWSLISGKSAPTKRNSPVYVHANEVLAQEDKFDDSFTKLEHSINEETEDVDGEQMQRRNSINLGLFSPNFTQKRVSQRERKRLSSLSETSGNAGSDSKNTSIDSSPTTNAWTTRTPVATPSPSPSTSDINASFFDLGKPRKSSGTLAATRLKEIRANIMQIQRDEQREKVEHKRMLNKPLWMTQAEEAAISELKKFYNIDNVFDELIEVRRVQKAVILKTPAVWYQQKDESM